MAIVGRYCKAYLLSRLRKYPGWVEELEKHELTKKGQITKDNQSAILAEETIVYLQETYQVTEDIYLDKNIIFYSDSQEWKMFCHNELDFSIPEEIVSEESASIHP